MILSNLGSLYPKLSENTFKKGSQAVPSLSSYFASSLSLVYIDHLLDHFYLLTSSGFSIAYIDHLLSIIKFNLYNMERKRTAISFSTEDIRALIEQSRPKYYSTSTSWNAAIRIFCNLNKIAVLFAPISPYWSISRINYPILHQRKIYFLLVHLYPLLAMSKVLY